MGERYDGWVKDTVAGPFLKNHNADNLPLPVANALEALVDSSLDACKQYKITRKTARQTVLESTGWKQESLRRFLDGFRDCTVNRTGRKGQIYPL